MISYVWKDVNESGCLEVQPISLQLEYSISWSSLPKVRQYPFCARLRVYACLTLLWASFRLCSCCGLRNLYRYAYGWGFAYVEVKTTSTWEKTLASFVFLLVLRSSWLTTMCLCVCSGSTSLPCTYAWLIVNKYSPKWRWTVVLHTHDTDAMLDLQSKPRV